MPCGSSLGSRDFFAMEYLTREMDLIGEQALSKLRGSTVALAGLGGVGGAAAEALGRAGVGALTLCDCDRVEPSNLNRQLFATAETIGMRKTEAAALRLSKAAPAARLQLLDMVLGPDTVDCFLTPRPDAVVDAIDSVGAKLALALRCRELGIPLITCLGTGNRLEADFKIGPIEQTAGCGCPLARVMRREMKKLGLLGATVLYSKSPPIRSGPGAPGTISFVPPAAGLMLAGWAVRTIIG